MKNTYNFMITKGIRPRLPWLMFLLGLFLLPALSWAQVINVSPTTTPANRSDFGTIAIGRASAPKTFTITATGVGASEEIRINLNNAPSFEVNVLDGNGFLTGNGQRLPRTGGTIRVRFRPGAPTGLKDEFIRISGRNNAGVNSFTDIFVTGQASGAGQPQITFNQNSLSFLGQTVGTASAAQTVTVNASGLSQAAGAVVTVNAPPSFQIRYGSGSFSSTTTIPLTNGGLVDEVVRVRFFPATVGNFISNVTFTNGNTTRNLQVVGQSQPVDPTLSASPASLSFGTTNVATATAGQSFVVQGSDLQNNITIAAPTGFQIRTGTNAYSVNDITLVPSGGTVASTTIDVRFAPASAGPFSDNVRVSTSNGASTVVRNVAVTGTATAPANSNAQLTVNPGALDFGPINGSGSGTNRTFEVGGTGLTGDIALQAGANVEIRNASTNGGFSNQVSISRTGTNPVITPVTIEVRIVGPVMQGFFNRNIEITTPGTSQTVPITANNSGGNSDISVSANGNEFTFVTAPTTVSAPQDFTVSGNNLQNELVIESVGNNGQYFQVSLNPSSGYSNKVTIPLTPPATNIGATLVYVRFVPGNNALTVTSTIRITSSGSERNVSVRGISEATIRLSGFIGAFPTDVVKGTVTAPRTVRVEGFLLAGPTLSLRFPPDNSSALNTLQTPLFEFSIDGGTNYFTTREGANGIPVDGNGNVSRDILVRYAPVRVGNAAQELQFKTPSIAGNTYTPVASRFGQATGFSKATQPTAQRTADVVFSADRTTATITFDQLDAPQNTAYGQSRVVFATSTYSPSHPLPPRFYPVDQREYYSGSTSPNGSYIFGTGDATEVLANSSTYVVYNGTQQSFSVTGLDPNLNYYFFSFDYNFDLTVLAQNYFKPAIPPRPLPVTLVSFSAKASGKQVNIRWETANETNNQGFELQRSADSRTFATILRRAGQGTTGNRTVYNEVDREPLNGLSYYRLKQQDLDGTVSYSAIVSVSYTKAGDVNLYPNPVTDQLTISTAGNPEGVAVTITDLAGRTMRAERLGADGRLNMASLPAGTYLISVGEGGARITRRIVKQ